MRRWALENPAAARRPMRPPRTPRGAPRTPKAPNRPRTEGSGSYSLRHPASALPITRLSRVPQKLCGRDTGSAAQG
jgi:hypothetical protein